MWFMLNNKTKISVLTPLGETNQATIIERYRTDLEIVVYPGILVPRIYLSLQNFFMKGGMKDVGLDYFGAACGSVFYTHTVTNTEQHAALW